MNQQYAPPPAPAYPAPAAPAAAPVPQGYGTPPAPMAPAPVQAASPPPAPAAPAAAPTFVAPIGGVADPFAGIGSAQSTERSQGLPAGHSALVEILRCEAIQAPSMGFGYVVHYRVHDCPQNPALNNQQYAWKNWAKNAQPFKSACNGFVKAVMGLGNSAEDQARLAAEAEPQIRASYGAEQPFAKRYVNVAVVATKTKNGHDFARHDWSRYTPAGT